MAPKQAAVHQDGKLAEPARHVPHPLLAKPVPHAYALIPAEGRPGLFYAVHLTDVVAAGLEHLEPNSRCLSAPFGLIRIHSAMERRHTQKKWSEP